MNHPVRVQEITTPSVCKAHDTPPGEGNVPVFNKGWDKVVLWNNG